MKEMTFNIAPLINNGRAILQIRRAIINQKDIDEIIETLLKDKEIRIVAVIRFKDPFLARHRLKELEMLPGNHKAP